MTAYKIVASKTGNGFDVVNQRGDVIVSSVTKILARDYCRELKGSR